ncbi:actin-like ATPase domain-containing protein [Leucogyrophana mollusca]|uniref:Actin-like ATPase domain-containing protein n=1 Tax=Leucogyrophana mollusca TaxID=85980 RepID=A0ACB8BKX3_9AGAM|nr:actin-like ATPase domain-containing protein [Leucogyrophana mollusca]
MSDSNIFHVPSQTLPSVSPADSYDAFRAQDTPLIIDNGASHLRFGFSTAPAPHSSPNLIAKYKERKFNQPLLLFGDAIDAESGAKGQAKSPWEGDVLLNFDALEHALDCAFIQLGIDAPAVDHPVLMTERLSSPLHSRALTSELMFEQYSVPSLTYCVDSLMSFYQNNRSNPFTADGLVVSFNTASTSVVPVLGGKGVLSHAKRIPWGAQQSTEYLLKRIQLKYPNFPTRVTSSQTSWMLHNFCEIAPDYPSVLRALKDPLKLRAAERIIQFPFALPVVEEKTEEELARIAEKRKEQGKKLQEMAAKNRMEKLLQKETDLQYLVNLKEGRGENKREWTNTLQSEGFDDDAALDETIKKLELDLKRARKKEVEGDDAMNVEEPSFPLIDVPDADLDDDSLKEKKKQKLLKAGFDARLRARREKEKEKEEKDAEERREEEDRERNFDEWAARLRREQEAIMNRIKDRGRRRAALSDRKSAAAQARMKNIASLAADDRVSKKKRKAGGEDMFGADDEDWAIYRKINTAAASSDEEEEYNQLQAIESKLLTYDPTFTAQHTHASITSQRSALITAFRPQYEEGDVEGNTRIHLNTERWRVCETYFSPTMAGVDSAGLGEVLQSVLARFSDAEKGRLVKNVFITGAPSHFPGLPTRLYSTLRPILPPEMPLGAIARAADPALDAWRGMAAFANTGGLPDVGVTRAEYEEWGGERVKRWWGGNWNLAEG